MPKPFTHIVIRFHEQKTDVLYRASDGMALACRQQLTVISGEDPNPAKKDHRNFLDENFAFMYLRKLADQDESAQAGQPAYASIEERDGESRIVKPNSLELGNKLSKAN